MKRPLILVSPSTAQNGSEFADASISLSNCYFEAVLAAGGLPVAIPCVSSREVIAEYVNRCDGVLLTGGDDVQTNIYAPDLPAELATKAGRAKPIRDILDLLLIDEVFRQRKPLLAICRGHQILNVALGGTLIVDIPTQIPGAIDHRCMERKDEPVHSVQLTSGSDLSKCLGCKVIQVNSTHHQAVGEVAEAFTIVATSEDGVVEAMELKDKSMLPFLISVQFHPERMIDINKKFGKLFSSFMLVSAAESRKNI
ncbi:MAG: gamma-glutamyl-gamma-aminobutyrate hydrolase family protein [Verrucomicrobia bacterium]|nr:gamma-glutamyl-gamma-aminobutyrate hydrolase family protein [Verrucomicrobiota bacterium]